MEKVRNWGKWAKIPAPGTWGGGFIPAPSHPTAVVAPHWGQDTPGAPPWLPPSAQKQGKKPNFPYFLHQDFPNLPFVPPLGGSTTSVCPPPTVGGPAVGVGEQQGAAGAALRGLQVEVPENEDEGGVGGGTQLPATRRVVGVGARVVPGAQRPAARRQHRVATAVPCGEIKRGGAGGETSAGPPPEPAGFPKAPKIRRVVLLTAPCLGFPKFPHQASAPWGCPAGTHAPPPLQKMFSCLEKIIFPVI